MAALKNTDIRINAGLHVNPSFIYAVFLWPYFKEMEETSPDAKDFDNIYGDYNGLARDSKDNIIPIIQILILWVM